MNLNHINLVVKDVAAATRFFENFFEFKCDEMKGENIVAVLKGAGGFTLVIMKSKEENPVYPASFHIGFMQERKEKVIELHERLKQEGYLDEQEPKKIRDSFGFYFTYQNIMIEVGHYY